MMRVIRILFLAYFILPTGANMTSEKIILTGASDGIGRALALAFARQGHSLALIARREELLLQLKKECEAAGSPKVLVASVDVTDESRFEHALETLDISLGGASVFIANAGVTGRTSFDETSWSQVKQTLSVNVMAAIHGLEIMKIKMLKRGSGTLCGVSSVAGARGMPTAGAYSTSKAALTTHLESLRVDLKPRGICVVTVAPGFIDTPMTKKNKGKMPFLMDSQVAAKIFARDILAGKKFSVAPWPYGIAYPIMQMLPRFLFDWFIIKAYAAIR
jgi:short-subunit dehydrogenase